MGIDELIGSIIVFREKLSSDDLDYIYCVLMDIVTNLGSS